MPSAPGRRMDCQILRDLFDELPRCAILSSVDADLREATRRDARPAAADRDWSRPGSCRNGLKIGTWPRPRFIIATSRICTDCSPAIRSMWHNARACRRGEKVAGNPRRRSHRLGNRLADQSLGASGRRRTRAYRSSRCCFARAHLSRSLRCASAFPDRRQFRRYQRHRRDAPAKPRRRRATAACASRRLAARVSERAARPRRV